MTADDDLDEHSDADSEVVANTAASPPGLAGDRTRGWGLQGGVGAARRSSWWDLVRRYRCFDGRPRSSSGAVTVVGPLGARPRRRRSWTSHGSGGRARGAVVALLATFGIGMLAAACTSTPAQPHASGHPSSTSTSSASSSSLGQSTGTTQPPGYLASLPDAAYPGGGPLDKLVLRASGRGPRALGSFIVANSNVHVQFWCDGPGNFTLLGPGIRSELTGCSGPGKTVTVFGFTLPHGTLHGAGVRVDPTTRWSLVVTEGP